jgi:cell wall-associated NlpC family hydrolase
MTGIVLGFLVVFTYSAEETSAQSIGVISQEFAEAYANPWLGASIAAFLEEGEIIDIISFTDGWITFRHDGGLVHVPKSSVAILQAEGLTIKNGPHGAFLFTDPTPFSDVAASVPLGTVLIVIGHFGEYYAVELGGQTAYVNKADVIGGLLDFLEEYDPNLFNISLTNGGLNGLVISANDYLTVVNTTVGLNLRTQPNANAAIIKSIPNGNRMEILELGTDWHKVRYQGEVGFVSSRFTAFSDELIAQAAVAPTNPDSLTAQIVANAMQYLGVRYTWGGTNAATGFDCSGFVQTVYRSVGITLNRVSRDQIRNGTIVRKNELMPGDLVFFATSGGTTITHVGIYIGNGEFIHSTSSNRRGVIISNLSESYYARTYVNAARIINQ